MPLIRTRLANHIRASSREQWLHQQARHMTAPTAIVPMPNIVLDRKAPSTHDPDKKFIPLTWRLERCYEPDEGRRSFPAISFVQVVIGRRGDTGKWIEQLTPQLLRIGSSAPWS